MDSDSKLISVIIPCYNVEKYLDRCLLSLENQTFGIEKLEIILVDDYSQDSTADLMHKWESKYPDNIMLVLLEFNGRQGRARNIGLSYSHCDIIAFLDSDDWIEKEYFERMFDCYQAERPDIVCCGHGRDPHAELYYWNSYTAENEKNIRFNTLVFDNCEKRQRAIMLPPITYNSWGKLIKKEFLDTYKIDFPEYLTYEDAYWGSLVNIYAGKVCILEDKLYHYYVNDNSTVLSRSDHHLDCLTVQEILWEAYNKRGLLEKYKNELEIEHIYSCFLAGIKASVLRYDIPNYNYYLLLRRLVLQKIPDYRLNPYTFSGVFKEVHLLILRALENQLGKAEYLEFAQYIKKIGI